MEWQVTFPDGTFENFNADRIFISQAGVLSFYDSEDDVESLYLAFAPGQWKKVQHVV